MNSNDAEILHGVAVATFEELCFIFEDIDMENESSRKFDEGKAAVVEFNGPFKGQMIVKASKNLLQAIASNMLGEDEPSDEQVKDALGEVLNVICGNSLPKISGSPKDVFNLDSPKIINLNDLLSLENEMNMVEVKVALEEGLCILQFIKHEE